MAQAVPGQGVPAGSRPRYAVLAVAVASNFAQFGARVVVSPFVLAIAAAFTVSKSEIGGVLTLLWGTFALLQYPSGVLADRYGERRVVLLAMGATAVGSLLVAAAPSFPAFALAAIALGAGAGLYFSVGSALLSKRYGDDQGLALSVHSAGAPLAGLAIPVAATAVATRYGWRGGVAVGALVAAVALALAAVVIDTTPGDPSVVVRDRLRPGTVSSLLSRPAVAFTTAVAVLGMYAFQSFVSFFPTFLQEYHGFTEGTASFAFGGAFVLIAVGLPAVGRFADRYGTDFAVGGPMFVAACGFALALVAPARPVALAGVTVVGVGITWAGALQSRFMQQFDDGERATGFGLVRTVFVFLGAAGNAITGVLADTAGWDVAYGAVVAVLLVAVALLAANRLLDLGL